MPDNPNQLHELADSLDGCYEWNHPPGSAEVCRAAAEEIERLRGIIHNVIHHEWSVTELREAIGELPTDERCPACGGKLTRFSEAPQRCYDCCLPYALWQTWSEREAAIRRLRAIIDADDEYFAAWDRFAFVCVPRGCGKTQLAAARERCVKARQAADLARGEG